MQAVTNLVRPQPSVPDHTGGALPTMVLRGVALHAVTEQQCIGYILDQLDHNRGGWVVTPNLDMLRRLVRNQGFAQLCTNASMMLADGMPLVWASKLQGTPLPERVAGSNLISSLTAGAAKHGRKVFLLGADEGVAESAAEVLRERHPGLNVGYYYPPMGFDQDEEAMNALTKAVQCAKPDIVYVALGSPKQEVLINRLRGQLPGTWWLGVGISCSFLSGDVHRAPVWVQRLGLEWVHRLVQEPRRLAKRYLIEGIPFAISLLCGAMIHRFTAKPPQAATCCKK